MDKIQTQIYERYSKSDHFSEDQLLEIRQGIESDLDVTVYARQNIPAADMSFIRKYLNYKKSIKDVEDKEEEKVIEKLNYEQKIALKATETFDRFVVFAITVSLFAILMVSAEILILIYQVGIFK